MECLASALAGAPRIAVDLESDSFYAYHHKICLVQISDDEADYIVDPLEVCDMSPLGPILRDPKVEKVFHAAEYDIQCLKRDYGFEVRGLFDTMAAARLLGSKGLGLAALISRYFDVTLSKKLQRADWGKRPLTREQLVYARLDTHYLLRLRDILHQELQDKDLWLDAQEEFSRLEGIEPSDKTFDPDDFWRVSGAQRLAPASRAVLKEIYFFREKTASETDKAPFRVMPEALMLRVAEQLPRTLEDLRQLQGMTPYLFSHFGQSLLELVHKGLSSSPIESKPNRRAADPWDTATLLRYQALRAWRTKKAVERGLDSILILSTEDLRELAKAPADGGGPSSWLECLSERKRNLYGEDLLKILGAPRQGSGRRRRKS